jgi:hypothetical protein
MSRSGYVEDSEDPLAWGRWRQAVNRSLKGKRGQAALQEMLQALNAMEDKRLYPGSFATPEGRFCALGALGAYRGTKMDDLGDSDYCDPQAVGARFGISMAMAAEIMFLNDEHLVVTSWYETNEICGPVRPKFPDWGSHMQSALVYDDDHPSKRWQRMRAWVIENLQDQPSTPCVSPNTPSKLNNGHDPECKGHTKPS